MPTNSRKSSSAEQTERPNGALRGGNGSITAADGTNGGTTHGLLGDIKQNVTSRVDEQKNRAADGLGGIANVFRSAGNELRNENEMVAQYVDMASDQLKRFADQIREKGVTDMLDDVHTFARRRPALFIGGAFLVGLGIARFLKSTAARQAYDQQATGFSSVDPMTASSVPSYGGTGYGEAGY
jgi:hypothetical protein